MLFGGCLLGTTGDLSDMGEQVSLPTEQAIVQILDTATVGNAPSR